MLIQLNPSILHFLSVKFSFIYINMYGELESFTLAQPDDICDWAGLATRIKNADFHR